MRNHDIYEELEKMFLANGEKTSTILGLLKKLAESLKETDIQEWTEKELYGYKDGDAAFPPCRKLKVKEIATCCTPSGQSFETTLSQYEYSVLKGWFVIEDSITISGVVLQQKPDVIASLYPIPGNDYRNVRVVADVQVVKSCESETRASAKQKFELICSKHSEIKKVPFTWLEIRGYIIGGIISFLMGIVTSALFPALPHWVTQFWKQQPALNEQSTPRVVAGAGPVDVRMLIEYPSNQVETIPAGQMMPQNCNEGRIKKQIEDLGMRK